MQLKQFFDIYELIYNSDEQVNFPTLKSCRFCDSKNTTFKQHAHLIPELFGKNRTKTFHECDSCNSKSSLWETSLSAIVLHDLALLNLSTKHRSPIFRNKRTDGKTGITISSRSGTVNIFSNDLPGGVTIDKGKKTIDVKFDSAKLNPFHAYKALLKIALLALPDKDFQENIHFLQVLQELDVNGSFGQTYRLYRMPLYKKVFEVPKLLIYRQKPDDFNFKKPDYIMVLYVGRRIFQFLLPISMRAIATYEPESTLEMELFPYFVYENRTSFRPAEINFFSLDLNETTSFIEEFSLSFKEITN